MEDDHQVWDSGLAGKISWMSVIAIGVLVLLLIHQGEPAEAHPFEIVNEVVALEIEDDGSSTFQYLIEMTFLENTTDTIPLRVPDGVYDPASAEATVDYLQVESIRNHTSLENTVELVLGTRIVEQMDPDRKSTVRFEMPMRGLVRPDEGQKNYVGVELGPTGFSRDLVGDAPNGNLKIEVSLPRYVREGDEILWGDAERWHDPPPEKAWDFQRMYWQWDDVDHADLETGEYDVYVGFPDSYMSLDFQDRTGEDGIDPNWYLFLIVIIAVPAYLVSDLAGYRRQRLLHSRNYYKPWYTVEGGEANRELNVVEAAVTLNRPITQVMCLIFLGALLRGFVEIGSDKHPIKLRRKSGKGARPLETAFLRSIEKDGTLNTNGLAEAFLLAVRDTVYKQKGFGLESTQRYYQDMCDRAWATAEGSSGGYGFEKVDGPGFEWMLLHKRYLSRMDDIIARWPAELVGQRAGAGNRPGDGYSRPFKNACRSIAKSINGDFRNFWTTTYYKPPEDWHIVDIDSDEDDEG